MGMGTFSRFMPKDYSVSLILTYSMQDKIKTMVVEMANQRNQISNFGINDQRTLFGLGADSFMMALERN
jgi:hypothetical protein